MSVLRLANDDNGSTVTISPGTIIALALEASAATPSEPRTGDPGVVTVTAVERDDDGNLKAELRAVAAGETMISATFQPRAIISRTRAFRVWHVTVRVQDANVVEDGRSRSHDRDVTPPVASFRST
jgi:hypothetical protein